jgi:hypothetical protein
MSQISLAAAHHNEVRAAALLFTRLSDRDKDIYRGKFVLKPIS